MEIFEFAVEKEKQAEQYYRQLAEKATHDGLKKILTMLADDETEHVEAIERMRAEDPDKVMETPVLAGARAIFERMRGSAEKFDFEISEVDLYRKVRDIEAEAKKYYLQKAEEVQDPDQREAFRKLAAEENKHLVLIQTLCDFVATPETYLENAEFSHLDDYVEGEY